MPYTKLNSASLFLPPVNRTLRFLNCYIQRRELWFVRQCFGGTETYEKTTGVNFVFGTSQGILTQPGTDYDNSRCQSYTVDSVGHRNSLHDKIGSNYFEKICLRGVSNLNAMCGDRLWSFERVVGAFLENFDDREERNIQSKGECEKLCLLETSFTCRSAEFDETLNICRLSREDRRSQPNAFRRQTGSPIDYLENQCVRSLPDCRYNVRQGSAVISMDELQFAASQGECEALCDQARGFTCRAFTYSAGEKRCYLSGDDSVSLSNAPLILKREAVYAEKQCSISQCEDGLFTFEKVTGHFLRSAQQVGLAMATSPGITLECGARCLEAGSDCPAFTLDYSAMKCFKLDRNTQGRGSELSSRQGQSYFEKICLRGNVRGCEGRAWAFERQPGKELRGHDDLKIQLVQSRRDCMEACLRERRFDCRSAEYDTQTAECRLTSEDRRTRPNDYVDAPPTIEYLENHCLPASAGSDALMSRPGTNYLERSCHLEGGSGTGPGPGPGPGPIPGPGEPQGTLFSRTDNVPTGSCVIGRAEYEKVTGYELQGQRAYRLLSENLPGITIQCAQLCRADQHCLGFNVDYNRNECAGLEGNAEKNRIDLRQVPGIAYFESICLRGVTCGLAWTFDRFLNYELRGFVNLQIPGISKTECEDRCLEERSFVCRSASYNHIRQECRLSSEDRFTQPQAFETSSEADYLENQCSTPPGRCPYRNMQRDRQLIYTDKSLSAFSDSSCQHACDVEREFVCRSFTFLSQTGLNTNQCLLSGSSGSTLGSSGFQLQSGALYAEKECRSYPTNGGYPPVYPGGPITRPPITRPGLYPEENTDGSLNPYPCRHTLTYEKIAGANYPVAHREPIRTRADIGISGECLVQCALMRQRCLAVSVEVERGGRQRCFSLERSADSDVGPLQPAPELAYFQKICLQGRPCAKVWAFTRVPNYEMDVPNMIEVRNMYSRRHCQDECLGESRIVCRSATYYGRERICKLSPETRRTQPQHFRRAATAEVDYMENECAPQLPSCEYTDLPGRFLPYTDRFVPQTYDVAECKHLCDQEREFPCRSFNFHVVRRECFLSSDDTFAADRTALLVDRDFFYSERGTCSNVRVDCTQADMLITFLFGIPFEGRVYATGNPQACFEMGNSQAQLVLRIPMGTQCGTIQQGRGRYVNHVVIQQNPVIMQETDKTVRVECSFDASDQTVSYAPSGTRDQEGGGISVTCPRDPNIFPALRVGPNRDLSADFKAFRFPSTATVNFVATVQFCQDACERLNAEGKEQSTITVLSLWPWKKPTMHLHKSISETEKPENISTSVTTIPSIAFTESANISEGGVKPEVKKSTTPSAASTSSKPPDSEVPNELPLQLRQLQTSPYPPPGEAPLVFCGCKTCATRASPRFTAFQCADTSQNGAYLCAPLISSPQ
uniref:Apple domain-containing protein n=1 Tax=Timema shepardi TaxID=629360 RepID=A0A7R9AZ28_TIMSH|nr:unnamed protein product [Timema shepardi]